MAAATASETAFPQGLVDSRPNLLDLTLKASNLVRQPVSTVIPVVPSVEPPVPRQGLAPPPVQVPVDKEKQSPPAVPPVPVQHYFLQPDNKSSNPGHNGSQPAVVQKQPVQHYFLQPDNKASNDGPAPKPDTSLELLSGIDTQMTNLVKSIERYRVAEAETRKKMHRQLWCGYTANGNNNNDDAKPKAEPSLEQLFQKMTDLKQQTTALDKEHALDEIVRHWLNVRNNVREERYHRIYQYEEMEAKINLVVGLFKRLQDLKPNDLVWNRVDTVFRGRGNELPTAVPLMRLRRVVDVRYDAPQLVVTMTDPNKDEPIVSYFKHMAVPANQFRTLEDVDLFVAQTVFLFPASIKQQQNVEKQAALDSDRDMIRSLFSLAQFLP